jgi:hypothetical protein
LVLFRGQWFLRLCHYFSGDECRPEPLILRKQHQRAVRIFSHSHVGFGCLCQQCWQQHPYVVSDICTPDFGGRVQRHFEQAGTR